ncbi:hypothetical protein JTE90_005158, partial [Oedothorax gibbosus]
YETETSAPDSGKTHAAAPIPRALPAPDSPCAVSAGTGCATLFGSRDTVPPVDEYDAAGDLRTSWSPWWLGTRGAVSRRERGRVGGLRHGDGWETDKLGLLQF